MFLHHVLVVCYDADESDSNSFQEKALSMMVEKETGNMVDPKFPAMWMQETDDSGMRMSVWLLHSKYFLNVIDSSTPLLVRHSLNCRRFASGASLQTYVFHVVT